MLNPHRLYFYRLLVSILPETSAFSLKRRILRWCGATVGDEVNICSSAMILGAGELTIGNHTWIGQKVTILATGKLEIGARVDIGPCCYIGNGTHRLDFSGERCAGSGISLPIIIYDGCWLGACVTVLPGVQIGPMTMVAASAVVTKPLSAYCLATGIPAKEKRYYSGEKMNE